MAILQGDNKAISSARQKLRCAHRVRGGCASVCPQNGAYGSVHGSSRLTVPLRNLQPMRQLLDKSDDLPIQVDEPTVGARFRHRSGGAKLA